MTRCRLAKGLAAIGLLVAGAGATAPARAADTVRIVATIDGRSVGDSTEQRPIRLGPKRAAILRLAVTNIGAVPAEVRTVRLRGEVMALTFFAYDTSVDFVVASGATETRTFEIDLVGLDGQATGLIQGTVSVLDANRHTLASERVLVDVRGSLRSVYGLFGLALVALTVLSLGGALIALATHRLPDNRWRRGLRFLTPGIGTGLAIVFALSAMRVFVPRPGRWVPILLVSAGLFFGLGYLTPSPDGEDEDEGEGEDNSDEDGAFDDSEDQSAAVRSREHT